MDAENKKRVALEKAKHGLVGNEGCLMRGRVKSLLGKDSVRNAR
jgi:hypothetical protein